MRTLGKLIWKYFIPCTFFLCAISTLLGDPNERISKSVPIVPGPYQHEIAAVFAATGLVLAFIIWRYQGTSTNNQ